jgi:hypothetical protein
MKLHIFTKIALILIFIGCLSESSFAYYDYYHHVEIEVTEVPYKPVDAFLGLNLQGGSASSGGNITLTSARASDVQFETLVGYRNLITKEGESGTVGSFDVMLGGAYFPRYPSFAIFDMPVRLKTSLLGGMSMASEGMFFSACFSMYLIFSSGDDPSGMTLGFACWSGGKSGETTLPGTAAVSLGFIFAPVAQ